MAEDKFYSIWSPGNYARALFFKESRVEIVKYSEWLSSTIKKLGMTKISERVQKSLEESPIGGIPVCPNLGYRELKLRAAHNLDFDYKILNDNSSFFICMPPIKNGNGKLKPERIQTHLRRVFTTQMAAEDSAKEAKWAYKVICHDFGKKEFYTSYCPADFDNGWLEGPEPFLPCAFSWSPAGLPDPKETILVPYMLKALGVLPICIQTGPFAEQLWVAYPGSFHEELVWMTSVIICIRAYKCMHPDDVVRLVQTSCSAKKSEGLTQKVKDEFIIEVENLLKEKLDDDKKEEILKAEEKVEVTIEEEEEDDEETKIGLPAVSKSADNFDRTSVVNSMFNL